MSAKSLIRAIDTLNEWVGSHTAYLILPIIGIISYEVVARFVFNAPTIWAGDVTTIVYGILVSLVGGYALLHDGHVRVDILFERLTPRGKAAMDVITAPLAFIFAVSLLWSTSKVAVEATASKEVLNTVFEPPMYPLRIILALGVLLICLQMVAKLLHNIRTTQQSGAGASITGE